MTYNKDKECEKIVHMFVQTQCNNIKDIKEINRMRKNNNKNCKQSIDAYIKMVKGENYQDIWKNHLLQEIKDTCENIDKYRESDINEMKFIQKCKNELKEELNKL